VLLEHGEGTRVLAVLFQGHDEIAEHRRGLRRQVQRAGQRPDRQVAGAALQARVTEVVAEVKWDGLRVCIAVAGGQVGAWSRSGRDITAAYPELGVLAAAAGDRTLVLDGEIVALSGPRPDFTALQRRMTASRPGAGLLATVPVTLIVFDVLRSGRDHLTGSPYVLRRALLDDLGLPVPGAVQVPPAFPGEAAALLAATREQGWEGIVLKRPASLYHPGRRTRDWLKLRNLRAVEVRVGGWLPGTGGRARLAGSVLMGLPRPGALEFAGAVGSGLSMAELRELTTLLQSLEQPGSPFTGPLPPRSPGTPGGPGPSSPPKWPTSSSPHLDGSANRCGAASDPASGRPRTADDLFEYQAIVWGGWVAGCALTVPATPSVPTSSGRTSGPSGHTPGRRTTQYWSSCRARA
jgi:hypothetical protein